MTEGDGDGGIERPSIFYARKSFPPISQNFMFKSIVKNEERHHNPRMSSRKNKYSKRASPSPSPKVGDQSK